MKKTTIILFSCALLLIIAGAILCFIGTRTGDVFDNTMVSDAPVTVEIGDNIKTISINLSEATVKVYGDRDCEKSYIEMVNVDKKYVKNKSATEMNITDKKDFLDIAFDTVQNFSGLRNIFFREQVNTGPKTINIYISKKEDVDLTKLKIVTKKGAVSIEKMLSHTSYYIEVDKATEYISLNEVKASDITMKVEDGTVSISDSAATGEAGIKTDIGSGAFYLQPGTTEKYAYSYDLTATNGSIFAPNEALIIKDGNTSTYKDTASNAEDGDASGDETELTNVTVVNNNGSIVIKSPEEDPKESEKTE